MITTFYSNDIEKISIESNLWKINGHYIAKNSISDVYYNTEPIYRKLPGILKFLLIIIPIIGWGILNWLMEPKYKDCLTVVTDSGDRHDIESFDEKHLTEILSAMILCLNNGETTESK